VRYNAKSCVVGQKWERTPSTVSGLSSIPLSPDVGAGNFMAEARGTTMS